MYNCRKHPAEQLGVELDSAGYGPSFDTQYRQRLTFKDREHEVFPNNEGVVGTEIIDPSGNREAIDIASTDHSNANKIQNMKSDPVMNGVSEMLWEDLQIGERIGIGKSPIITVLLFEVCGFTEKIFWRVQTLLRYYT